MTSTYFCATCNQYKGLFPERHLCPPQWYVYAPEYDGYDSFDECDRAYYAADAEAAAVKWAERYDTHGDYHLAGGSEVTVRVRGVDADDSTAEEFVVSAEQVVEYSARKVEPK